jgi:hypothetical protein
VLACDRFVVISRAVREDWYTAFARKYLWSKKSMSKSDVTKFMPG